MSMKTVFFNDKERLEYLSDRLPQSLVEEIYSGLDTMGLMHTSYEDKLIEHLEVTMNIIGFKFDSKKTQEAYVRFNKSVEKLFEFLQDHFAIFVPEGAEKSENNRYELYPRQRRGTSEEREFFSQCLRQDLRPIAQEFGRSYFELIDAGIKGVVGTQPNTLDPEKPQVVGLNFYPGQDIPPIEITGREEKLLNLLLSELEKTTARAYEYTLVSKDDLINKKDPTKFKSKKAFDAALGNLKKKNNRMNFKIFDIHKNTERRNQRSKISGYRIEVFRPQKMRESEES